MAVLESPGFLSVKEWEPNPNNKLYDWVSLQLLEISWSLKSILEILEITWKSPGTSLMLLENFAVG